MQLNKTKVRMKHSEKSDFKYKISCLWTYTIDYAPMRTLQVNEILTTSKELHSQNTHLQLGLVIFYEKDIWVLSQRTALILWKFQRTIL